MDNVRNLMFIVLGGFLLMLMKIELNCLLLILKEMFIFGGFYLEI